MDYQFKTQDLQDEMLESMENSKSTFTRLAIQLLDACYRTDEKATEKFITDELKMLKDFSCLDLAVYSEQLDFVAHSSVQVSKYRVNKAVVSPHNI